MKQGKSIADSFFLRLSKTGEAVQIFAISWRLLLIRSDCTCLKADAEIHDRVRMSAVGGTRVEGDGACLVDGHTAEMNEFFFEVCASERFSTQSFMTDE